MPWADDDKILDIVKGLCVQLNISNYNPTSIAWKSEVDMSNWFSRGRYGPFYTYKPLPYDQCVLARNTVILPRNMQDQLQSDEWKPIIASALFYKKKLLIRRITGLALRALMFVAMAAVLFIALPILIPQQITMVDNYGVPHTNSMGWLIASYTGPVLVIAGTFVLDIWYLRNIRLLADRDAANIVGAPVFLAVLNKIAALDVEGYGKTHDRRGACFRYLHPIGQRIANLQTSSS